jgi:hypothetical protein
MVSLEFDGLGAGGIKRHPEIEALLLTGDNRAEVIQKVLAPSSLRGAPATKQSLLSHLPPRAMPGGDGRVR